MEGGEAHALTTTENKSYITGYACSPNARYIAFASADEPCAEREAKIKGGDDAEVYGKIWPRSRLRLLYFSTGELTTLCAE